MVWFESLSELTEVVKRKLSGKDKLAVVSLQFKESYQLAVGSYQLKAKNHFKSSSNFLK